MSTDELQQFVEQVRDKTSIEAVLREAGVQLKREGTRLRGLCPLHADRDPSLVVFPAEGAVPEHFRCFGCQQHGDVFALLQLLAKAGNRWSAIVDRAKALGLEMPHRNGTGPRPPHPAEALLAIARRAYADHMSPDVFAYLAKRGFPETFVKTQGIGYAPPGERLLVKDALTKAGANLALARGASLIGGKDDADYFSQYGGGWIIFPNRRHPNRVIDLQGRAFPEAQGKPKWLTRRGRVMALWGMDALRQSGEIVIAEGIVDGLSLVLADVPAVAVFGQGGFKADWAPWFARQRTVCVAYDRDSTPRAVQVAKLFGPRGRLVLLPKDLGPKGDLNDLLVHAGSPNRFRVGLRKLLSAAPLPLEVEIVRLEPGGIVGLRKRLEPLLREIASQELFVRDHLLRLLAERTGLTLETLRQAVREAAPRRGGPTAASVAAGER